MALTEHHHDVVPFGPLGAMAGAYASSSCDHPAVTTPRTVSAAWLSRFSSSPDHVDGHQGDRALPRRVLRGRVVIVRGTSRREIGRSQNMCSTYRFDVAEVMSTSAAVDSWTPLARHLDGIGTPSGRSVAILLA